MTTAGCIVWLTGPPAAGKSTLARETAATLRALGLATTILDGDEVRAALVPSPGYDADGRDAFYETLARLAALIARQGSIVLVPATAHLRRFRARARDLAGATPVLEVFVDTPAAECIRRDPKGLYHGDAAARLPGSGLAYEPPEHPDVVVRPGDPAATRLVAALAAMPR